MDRIIITAEDEDYLTGILKQIDNQIEVNISFSRDFYVELEKHELIILVQQNQKEFLDFTVNNYDENGIYFMNSFIIDDTGKPSNFKYSPHFEMNKKNFPNYEESIYSLALDIIQQIMLFFHILNNYRDYQIIIEKEVVQHKYKDKKNKSKKKRKSSNRIVRVVNKVLQINDSLEVKSRVTRSIKRKWRVEEFNRRGHYRHLKSGKKVWVRAAVVKTGVNNGEKGYKTYKL